MATSPLSSTHLAELAQSGLSPEQAAQTCHTTVDADQAKALVGHALPGLLFAYHDQHSKPYQIHHGKWGRKPYLRLKPDWTMVPGAVRQPYLASGSLPKYLSAPSSGSRPYLSQLQRNWERVFTKSSVDLIITEGEKKGDALCAHGEACLALAGVSSFVDRSATHEDWVAGSGSQWDTQDPAHHAGKFLPELEEINWSGRQVAVCFDSDFIFKRPVQSQTQKLIAYVRARKGSGYPVILPTESDGAKNGLDDFLVRHGIKAWKVLRDAFAQLQQTKQALIKFKRPGKFELVGGTLVPYPDEGPRDGETDKQYEGRLKERCFLEMAEPPKHIKALMAWAVLKERWAYRPGLGWYQWVGTHWEICLDAVLLEAELTRFMDAQGWIDRSLDLTAQTIKDFRSRVVVPEVRWSAPHLVNFTNGTLNTKTGELRPHNPQDYQISSLPFAYDPSAQCSQWDAFLSEATGGDPMLQAVLRAWMRWILAPKDRSRKFPIEKSLAIIGRKGGGKGTFLGVLRSLVGEKNIGSAAPEVFSTAEGLGQLVDKSLALDPDATGFMGGIGNYNKIVSNEPLLVKKLYKDPVTVCLGVVVVQAFNRFLDMPSTGSEGTDRRMCVIPFDHQPAQPDERLAEKLAEELPGIFSWAWSMSLNMAIATISWSGNLPQVQRASIERFEFNNPVYRFLLETYPQGHPDGMKASYVFSDYQEWAKANGHKCMSQTTFGTEINRLGVSERTRREDGHYYLIPPMDEFDVAGYLRIRTNSPCPEGLSSLPCASLPEPLNQPNPYSLVSEALSEGSDPSPNPTAVERQHEGSVGSVGSVGSTETSREKRSDVTPLKSSNDTQSYQCNSVRNRTGIMASATLFRKGGWKLPKPSLKSYQGKEAMPLEVMPEWLQQEVIDGSWEVCSHSSDGERSKLRNRQTGREVVVDRRSVYEVQVPDSARA